MIPVKCCQTPIFREFFFSCTNGSWNRRFWWTCFMSYMKKMATLSHNSSNQPSNHNNNSQLNLNHKYNLNLKPLNCQFQVQLQLQLLRQRLHRHPHQHQRPRQHNLKLKHQHNCRKQLPNRLSNIPAITV